MVNRLNWGVRDLLFGVLDFKANPKYAQTSPLIFAFFLLKSQQEILLIQQTVFTKSIKMFTPSKDMQPVSYQTAQGFATTLSANGNL